VQYEDGVSPMNVDMYWNTFLYSGDREELTDLFATATQ
jgi:hypothetical protein